MTNFSIEYNPYLVKCTFKLNGKVLNSNNRIGAKSNERLQILLGELGNWKGLLKEIDNRCDDDKILLHFKGRKIDYDDLRYTLQLYPEKEKFQLSFEEVSKNDNNIIAALDKIFAEIKEKNLPEFKVPNKDGKDIFKAYEEVKNGIFEVSVIATMSSGKSTLINSLLHKELLPSKNEACTATIARILDNDDMDGYEAECYAADGKTIIYRRSTVDAEKLQKYNSDKNVAYIDIEGNIPAIDSNKIRLCLRDTPGPNNSRDENHGRLTQSIIKRTNAVVLYVLNTTNQEVNDDKALLQSIADEMATAGKQSRDRFIFVVNKCDELDEEKGETIEKLLQNTREYLKQFGITEPTLIPTSALLALVVRKNRNHEHLSRKETKALAEKEAFVENEFLHFEKYATLTPTVRAYLQKQVDKYNKNNDDWDLEAAIHSGVPAVEQTIKEYIDKYAYPIKINDAITDIVRILDELDMKAKFAESLAKDEKKLEQVRGQIDQAQKKHQDSESVYQDFKSRIEGLEMGGISEVNEQRKVERQLEAVMRPYLRFEYVDKTEADRLILEFQGDLEVLQRKCEQNLNREIDLNIFQKCNEILENYAELVRSILGNIEIDGYDFQKINSFERIRISNINDLKLKNQHDRFRTETRWKDNPAREGFWGFFKFWEPKEISYTVQVKDGVDVDVDNIIISIMDDFTESLKDNISSMFEQANKQMKEYKKTFKSNIDSLKSEIEKILFELSEKTKQSEVLKEEVEKNRKKSNWVAQEEEKIRNLLTF